ncbi:MAG: outer membrane protein transport protein [Thermoanaerobaculia bacterium]
MVSGNRWSRFGTVALLGVAMLASSSVLAGGFAIHEKGAKATGMGGAFTALADDPSAMYYNPAGLADNDKLVVMAGVTLIPYFSSFEGANPYPGQGYKADFKTQIFFPPHIYIAAPIAKGFNIALGIWSPYGLSTAWEDPDTFAGRFLSQRVDLRTFAIGLQGSYAVTDWLSIGAGPELRIGDVKLQRNIPVFNPFTDRFVDAAHVDIVGDGFQSALSWAAGIQLKPCPRLKIGASYHGAVDIDFKGNSTFYPLNTGNAQLNGVLASRLPFNVAVPTQTTVQFPGLLQMGVSYAFTERLTAELDADYTNWDVFDQTVLHFDTVDNKPVPQSVLVHNWENSWTFRGGLDYRVSKGFNLNAGLLIDTTPQPDTDVSPLLPDANRTGVSIGFGLKMGESTTVELSNLALFFHKRTTLTNRDNFNGTYKTFADLITFNLRHTF